MYRAALWLVLVTCISVVAGCSSSAPPPAAPVAQAPSGGASTLDDGASANGSVGTQTQYPGGNDGANVASNSAGYGDGYDPDRGNAPAGVSGPPGYGSDYNPDGNSGAFGAMPGSDGYGAQPGFPGGAQPGFPGSPQQRRVPPKKLTLKDRSIASFQAGNTRRAQILFGAYALQASDEEATEVVSNYRWSSHRVSKRPVLGANVAVGATIKNPRNISDLSPIGSDSNSPSFGGSMDSMGSMGSPGGSAQDKKSFSEITGDVGKKLAAAFTEKHTDGVWSPVFQEYSLSRNRPGMQNQMNNGFSDGGSSFGPAGGSFSGGSSSFGVGEAPFFQRPGDDDGYGGMPGGFPGGNNQNPAVIGAVPGDSILPAGYSAIAPGMTYIGTGDQAKLLKKAAQEGFDCLIIFELDIRPMPNSKTANDTRIKAMLPREVTKDVKSIGASKTLNNVQVAKARSAGSSDGVEEAIELVIKKLEDNLVFA
ncbi:MAG: hypothetical protein ABL921_25420, partial [Pirellula sp.]